MHQQPPRNDDPRSRLAAELFPREWAAIANKPGASKKRQQLRQRAEEALKLRDLRGQGASCATCRNFQTRGGPGKPWCEADSDFQGYPVALPDGLCGMWAGRLERENSK